jgi:hypothetical protein
LRARHRDRESQLNDKREFFHKDSINKNKINKKDIPSDEAIFIKE